MPHRRAIRPRKLPPERGRSKRCRLAVSANAGRGPALGAYPYAQLIAPIINGKMPALPEFCEVMCHDIGAGGFSFYVKQPPTEPNLVVAFGAGETLTYLTARQVHLTPTRRGGQMEYIVGWPLYGPSELPLIAPTDKLAASLVCHRWLVQQCLACQTRFTLPDEPAVGTRNGLKIDTWSADRRRFSSGKQAPPGADKRCAGRLSCLGSRGGLVRCGQGRPIVWNVARVAYDLVLR